MGRCKRANRLSRIASAPRGSPGHGKAVNGGHRGHGTHKHHQALAASERMRGWLTVSGAAITPNSAGARAHQLLKIVLSADEYAQVMASGYVEIASPTTPERVYRVPRGPGFVRMFERGVAIIDLCVQPAESLPVDDIVIMH